MKKNESLRRILINAAIIVGVILAIAIASHFVLRATTRHGARRTVPEFKGISLREAELLAAHNDLDIYINDSLYVTSYPGGTVLDQLPVAGVEVKPGRTVYVVINAYGDRMVEIPYVAGSSLRQAKNMLEVAGFEIAKINYVSDMATNYVLSQSYQSQTIDAESEVEAAFGSGLELTVGVNYTQNPSTQVPNLIGMRLAEAKSRIWEAGLNVGRINIDQGVNLLKNKDAKVYIQGVAADSLAAWGSTLSVRVTLDKEKIESALAEVERQRREAEKARREAQEAAELNKEIETQEAEILQDEFDLY